jgi:hypothetical protein
MPLSSEQVCIHSVSRKAQPTLTLHRAIEMVRNTFPTDWQTRRFIA